jgi:hypothetical protein
MGAKDIAEDECRRIHAIVPSRDVRLRARLHGEIFSPEDLLFRARKKFARKKDCTRALSRAHASTRRFLGLELTLIISLNYFLSRCTGLQIRRRTLEEETVRRVAIFATYSRLGIQTASIHLPRVSTDETGQG